jgi:hypothetical protein
MSTIDLRKQIVREISLAKKIQDVKAQVVLVMDYSGSMDELYRSGFVQRLIERLVPVAMQFDDNGEMEMYMFHNSSMRHKNAVTESNVAGVVSREITPNYRFGGTSYAPPINAIIKDFLSDTVITEKKSFFGIKSSTTTQRSASDPVYVIFITDGQNDDQRDAERAIREASKYGAFFQFIGIGNARLDFLEKLDDLDGRVIDNANFFQANNLDNMSDKDLYDKMLTEFPQWLTEAKSKGII